MRVCSSIFFLRMDATKPGLTFDSSLVGGMADVN